MFERIRRSRRQEGPVPLYKDSIENIAGALSKSMESYPTLTENAAICLRSVLDGLDEEGKASLFKEAAAAARTIMPSVEKCAKDGESGVGILLGLGYIYLLYHATLAESFQSYGEIATVAAAHMAEQYKTPPLKDDPSIR